MSAAAARIILFIGTDGTEQSAAQLFEAVAHTFGLPWTVLARTAGLTTGTLSGDDLTRATIAIGINQGQLAPILAQCVPDAAHRVEYWAPECVEREVPDLVARLLGGKRADEAPIPPPPPVPTRKPATVRVGRETAGRRGKGVTTVWDVPLGEEDLRELAASLKQKCGTGGTVKDGRIEIQGEHRDRIVTELEKLGYKVKRSGG